MSTAASVALAIDDLVEHPVLVVGSPPPDGRDLDLLATPSDVTRIEDWLHDHGFRQWGHTWARLSGPAPYAVELSSLERWSTRGCDGTSLLEGAAPLPGHRRLVRPSPATTLLLAARGTVSRRGRLHAKTRRRVDEALRRDPHAWEAAAVLARPLGMAGALRLLRRAHRSRSGLSAPVRGLLVAGALWAPGPVRARLRLVAGARPQRWRPALVSFSGLDGSGKSTQVARLQQRLAEVGVTADTEWAGFRSARKVRALLPALDRTLPGAPPRDPLLPSRVRDHGPARTAWVFVVALVNVLHLWRLVVRRGGPSVLILDRFAPDTTVKIDLHFQRSRGVDTTRPRTLFTRLTPRADVAFLVEVTPETAYTRRQEQTPEELSSMAELYREQVDRYALRVVDGTRPQEELADDVAVAAWEGLR